MWAFRVVVDEPGLEGLLKDIYETIERMDFRWSCGFIVNENECLENRLALQQEPEHLTPIPEEELAFAVDLLAHFGGYWEAAKGKPDEQERLLKPTLVRVWVVEDRVVKLCLRPNLYITAGLETKRPTEISVDLDSYRSGGDERRSLSGRWVLVPPFAQVAV
jgi:hypothetical protein